MTSKSLKSFRFLILIFGFAIITLAMFLFDNVSQMSNEHIFMWIVIYLATASILVPSLFPPQISADTTGRIVGLSLLFTGAIPFVICSVGLIFLALYKDLKFAIILESIVLFIFVIRLFFVFLTGNHIGNVTQKEKNAISKIASLRTLSSMLNIKINSLDENFSDAKKLSKSVEEDFRYLSPVQNEYAINIEEKLQNLLSSLDSKIETATTTNANLSNQEIVNDLQKIKQVISQRKSILN